MFIILLWVDREQLFDNDCYIQKRFSAEHWHGIVERKFIDASNHSLPSLTVRDTKGDSLTVDMFRFEHIYDKINLGNTIVKHQGSKEILRWTNHAEQLIGNADFGCNVLK